MLNFEIQVTTFFNIAFYFAESQIKLKKKEEVTITREEVASINMPHQTFLKKEEEGTVIREEVRPVNMHHQTFLNIQLEVEPINPTKVSALSYKTNQIPWLL